MSLPLPEVGVLIPAALLVCLLCNRNKNISGQSLLEDEGQEYLIFGSFVPVYSSKNIDYLNDGDGLQIKRPNAELKIEFLWCELCVLPVFVCFF